MSDDSPTLARQIEILELFAEHSRTSNLRAMLAPSQYEGERPQRGRRFRIPGFAEFREWEAYGSWQERRESREQLALDRESRRRQSQRRRNSRYEARHRDKVNARRRQWRMNPERRAAECKRLVEYRRRKRDEEALAKEQAARLEAWKASPRPNTKRRVDAMPEGPEKAKLEKRRAQRAAQAQRRRDRMTPEQRQAESVKASARRKAK